MIKFIIFRSCSILFNIESSPGFEFLGRGIKIQELRGKKRGNDAIPGAIFFKSLTDIEASGLIDLALLDTGNSDVSSPDFAFCFQYTSTAFSNFIETD
jgi:hypothetical protein